MDLIKKDWMYDAKIMGVIAMAVLSSVAALIIILVKITNKMPVENGIDIYNRVYSIMVLALSFYPMFAFRAVCPQMGSDKLYMSTANLPYSRKQVFFKGLKSWFIIFPIVLVVGALGSAALNMGTGAWSEGLFITLVTPLLIICFIGILQLQFMAACIIHLVKGIKGYKVVTAVILFDLALIALCSIGLRVFKVNTAHDPWWMFGCGIFIFIATLMAFLIAWRDIEKVYQ